MKIGFAGWYILEEVMYYMRSCLAGEHVQECVLCEWTCILEIHVLK